MKSGPRFLCFWPILPKSKLPAEWAQRESSCSASKILKSWKLNSCKIFFPQSVSACWIHQSLQKSESVGPQVANSSSKAEKASSASCRTSPYPRPSSSPACCTVHPSQTNSAPTPRSINAFLWCEFATSKCHREFILFANKTSLIKPSCILAFLKQPLRWGCAKKKKKVCVGKQQKALHPCRYSQSLCGSAGSGVPVRPLGAVHLPGNCDFSRAYSSASPSSEITVPYWGAVGAWVFFFWGGLLGMWLFV